MTISKRRLLWLIFVCALSVHPTAEAVRRFFYYSDVIYAVADAAFLIFAVTAYWIAKPRISIAPLLLLSVYFFWGMLCLLINGVSAKLKKEAATMYAPAANSNGLKPTTISIGDPLLMRRQSIPQIT